MYLNPNFLCSPFLLPETTAAVLFPLFVPFPLHSAMETGRGERCKVPQARVRNALHCPPENTSIQDTEKENAQ